MSVKAYKAVIYGVDFENQSNQKIIDMINHQLSHYGFGHVKKFGFYDIEEWEDDHPMNQKDNHKWFDSQDYKKVDV